MVCISVSFEFLITHIALRIIKEKQKKKKESS